MNPEELRANFLTNFEWRNKLRETDQKEEEVKEKFELIKQNNWNECENVVFLILDLVCWIALWHSSSIHVHCSFL